MSVLSHISDHLTNFRSGISQGFKEAQALEVYMRDRTGSEEARTAYLAAVEEARTTKNPTRAHQLGTFVGVLSVHSDLTCC